MYVNVLNNTRGKFYFVIQKKKTENICRMMPEVRDLKKNDRARSARSLFL